MKNTFEKLANVFKKNKIECEFTILEIGAMKLKEDLKERFYILLDYFPSSKIIGFEIDKDVCDKMNSENSKGIKYTDNFYFLGYNAPMEVFNRKNEIIVELE